MSAGPTCTMSVDRQGVATIVLTNAPVNALHPDVLAALQRLLEECHGRSDVKCVVITGSGKNFCAGFDIAQFAAQSPDKVKESVSGASEILTRVLEEGSKPTVAAIQGVALGGGCEVAAACNARVATPDAKIGLPELQLGIIPGFGGTQRLPRLVGLQTGLELILTSKSVKGSKAHSLGLVDEVAQTPQQLLAVAKAVALDLASGKRKRVRTLEREDRLEPKDIAKMILGIAKEQTKKRAPNVMHPLLCIDAIEAGILKGGKAGLAAETAAFNQAAQLPAHKALVNIFFAARGTKKVKGVSDGTKLSVPKRKLQTVAVIGGGLMGSGIATASLQAGMSVVLKEINQKFLDAGIQRIHKNLESRVKKGRLSEDKFKQMMSRVKGVLTYSKQDFQRVDIVIEAVIEVVGLKQQIFKDLEEVCRPDCVLSTNTSTIDITVIAEKMRNPERIIGAHFFSPAHVMPLLEIVRSNLTPPDITRDLLRYGSMIKKTPVVVGNCTGFAVNRVFFPYTMAAMLLADAGVDAFRIDKIVQKVFGMPMGPFRLSDLVGGDIGQHVGANFIQSFPERTYGNANGPLVQMNQKKWLGEKTGRGFYRYDKGEKKRTKMVKDLEAIGPVFQESRRAAQQLGVPHLQGVSDRDIVEMIFFPVVNEACRVLAEGVVEKSKDMDIATVMSMGFPAYRGGLVHWADSECGASYIASRLQTFASMFPQQSGFFVPCEYLLHCAYKGVPLSQGQSFYVSPIAKL
ncbi:3-hydroxyacyl-CoA dehydrogenase [Chloropicon primus]|uniref:3-hydroxyacyl-CoA dehydrogenase n=1 Tax=Chloropicon primus TaxID=1764295 RepID=A0A5B8MRC9_9CHLO|nr:3-hydroxyacyl-CoA dehydrogenase [Chloropicon primus]UPR02165.1 3-hydroxyacyl-CoA dehydrogenase [Chloropicon primus]|mmetsp:Transcript_3131/g.8625  ORF Transcript_3131/g.8625 Transcript_3131/m.8625 type:complete len:743 (-) Transcript_3131:57-2285(-)|eukprot:QDZ22941.1 3-hydroxyacyl-CoA dehydrogenase [Chloropicon primus]